MADYKDTKKYSKVPSDVTTVYTGVAGEVEYSGKSKRVDDNFTNIVNSLGNGSAYYAGDGLYITTTASRNTFNVDFGSDSGSDTEVARRSHTHSYDSLTGKLTAGSNVSIVNNVISATNTTYDNATSDSDGLMSATDKAKLDNLSEYTLPTASTTTKGGVKIDGTTITISDAGVITATLQNYPTVTTSTNGLMLATDKAKLDGIPFGANYIYAGSNGYISRNNTYNDILVYTLPKATTSVLGGVKIDGTTITSTDDGKISANISYSLPTASASVLGGVKIGSGVNIVDGVISVPSYNMPTATIGTATTGTLGGVKVDGETINIVDGVIKGTITNVGTGLAVTRSRTDIGYYDTVTLKIDPSASNLIQVTANGIYCPGRDAISWGDIDGTLTDQTDLAVVLNTKATTTALTTHTSNGTIHISSAERTTWEAAFDNLSDHIANSFIHVTSANKNTWTTAATSIESHTSNTNIHVTAANKATWTAATNAIDSHVADTTIHVTSVNKNTWNNKQDALVSGTNIKTINGSSILGAGNITISGGGSTYSAGDGIEITSSNTLKAKISSTDGNTITMSNGGLYCAGGGGSGTVSWAAITGTDVYANSVLAAALNAKQNSLPSGDNNTYLHKNATGTLEWTTVSGGGTITDVQVAGTTVVSSGVANIPVASTSTSGVVKVDGTSTRMENGVIKAEPTINMYLQGTDTLVFDVSSASTYTVSVSGDTLTIE